MITGANTRESLRWADIIVAHELATYHTLISLRDAFPTFSHRASMRHRPRDDSRREAPDIAKLDDASTA